jgi:hypothetical protein
MFGGCSEQNFDDLLDAWFHVVKTQIRREEAKGMSWGLEEVWTQLWLLMNRCENKHDIVPTLVSMFGG